MQSLQLSQLLHVGLLFDIEVGELDVGLFEQGFGLEAKVAVLGSIYNYPLHYISKLFLQSITNLMLLIQKYEKVKLKREEAKILKLSTAVQGYVYICTTSDHMNQKLVHIDQGGEVLWQKQYEDSVDTFGMVSEREVVVLNPKEQRIEVVDLHTHTLSHHPHQFTFDSTAYMEIYVFNDSKTFAVVERGSVQDNRLFITYYSSQFIKEQAAYRSKEQEWSTNQQFAKVNNHSQFAWWKPKYDSCIDFYTFDIRVGLRNIKVDISLAADYKIPNFGIEIANLWETTPDTYCLVCNTNRPIREQSPVNNNYILDASKSIIREAAFSLGQLQNQLMDYFNLGEISVIRTFGFEKGTPVSTPVYYVHNQRQQVIAREVWACTSNVNYYIPGFDTSTVIEASHSHDEVKEIEITTKKLMTPQEMYLHFMLHIYEDFDDNLLEDAIDLLTN